MSMFIMRPPSIEKRKGNGGRKQVSAVFLIFLLSCRGIQKGTVRETVFEGCSRRLVNLNPKDVQAIGQLQFLNISS